MKLNEKIYSLRKHLGLSQEDLASKLNVSRQSVSNWETGAANPEIGKLSQLAEVLGVSVDFLLDEKAGLDNSGQSHEQAEDSETSGSGEKKNRTENLSDKTVGPTKDNYPGWLDSFPKFLQKGIYRYGWLYGIHVAISGVIFIVVSYIGRAMANSFLKETASMGFGNNFEIIDGGDLPPELLNQIGGSVGPASSQNSAMFVIPDIILVVGIILTIAGLLLAFALKRWGKKQLEEKEN